jgi:hypothetical protein
MRVGLRITILLSEQFGGSIVNPKPARIPGRDGEFLQR